MNSEVREILTIWQRAATAALYALPAIAAVVMLIIAMRARSEQQNHD